MNEERLYNSRLLMAYITYITKFHPEVDRAPILEYAGITRPEVEDEGHWFTQQQVDRFHSMLQRKTNNPAIAREVGRNAPFQGRGFRSAVAQYTKGFITPVLAYASLGQIAEKLSYACRYETKRLGRRKVQVTSIFKEGVRENPYQCENRLGMLEALAKIYTGKNATVTHDECYHRGHAHCRYIVTWENPPSAFWKQLRNGAVLVYLAAVVSTIPVLTPEPWAFLVLSGALAVSSLSYLTERREKGELIRNLTSEADMADRLITTINLRYNESLLVREVGQATSMILDVDALLKFIIEALKKRLDFDRGMIMLADAEQKTLRFVVGFGYDAAHEELLRGLAFHLDRHESKGPAVMSFKTQTPYLINDIASIEKDLSPRTREFIRFAGTQAFISVPIVYKGVSMGVLFVDNVVSKRKLTNSDMSLLMGIAPQIAISINNAISYQKTQESEQRFRTLSENAPDIIYTLDITGTITYVNPAWQQILGHAPADVIAQDFTRFISTADGDGFARLLGEIGERRNFRDVPVTILHHDGSKRYFTMSGAPNLGTRGEVTGFTGTLKDVTERRSLEEQLRHASKMEAVGTLTSGIAHDFNNIIQAISGYTQLLAMRSGADHPDRKYLESIGKLVDRSAELIRQLLIFSRKMECRFEPLDLSQEIETFYELLVRSIPKMIAIRFDMDEGLHPISGDRTQLGQVIMNLAVNAADAMPEGGTITISTENVVIGSKEFWQKVPIMPGRYVLIRVSDTGSGMDGETLGHIFEPFFTTKAVGKGTGLGLSVVYGIVKNHGGYITCESEQGTGTTFYIYLPALEEHDRGEGITTKNQDQELAGTETILLVDDEEYLLDGGKEILDYYGYRALVAGTGEKALEILSAQRKDIDLVIMDLIMPGMGGLKCLGEILKIDPAARVIIASGYAAGTTRNDLMAKGAAGFIEKPYRLQDLLGTIRSVLDGKAD